MTFRFLTSAAIADTNSFCRELNEQPGDVGTKTAIRQSEFPFREIRKLPKPDEHTELYEYQLPEMYREKLMQRLNSPEFNMRYVEVSTMKGLYVLQQAKPKDPKSKGSVQSAEDLVYEVCTALQEEPPTDSATLSPMIPEVFPNSVPHMRFQRITTVSPEVSLSDLALKLWDGGRLFLKDLTNDRRVRFGQWSTSAAKRDPPARPQSPEEVVIFAPSAIPMDSIRMCLAQFGHFVSLSTAHAGQPRMVAFRVAYKFRESAVLAHEMVFEIATGEVWIHGQDDATLLQCISAQLTAVDEEPEENDWWRFELGKLYGSQEAIESEHNRLTLGNLAKLSKQAQSHSTSREMQE